MSVFSVGREEQDLPAETHDVRAILAKISAGASERDANPAFPEDPFVRLAPTGALAIPVPDPIGSQGRRATFAEEWRVLRAVAGADGSVGRILDGHFNGVERVSLLAPEPLRSRELEAIAAGKLLLGVWGADPIPGEGEPARLVQKDGGAKLIGVKTFCSGATGLDRALVLVRGPSQGTTPSGLRRPLRRLKGRYSWFRGAGMRASESHRVVFEGSSGARRSRRTGRTRKGTLLQQGRHPNGRYLGRDLRHGRRRRARRTGRQSRGWRAR